MILDFWFFIFYFCKKIFILSPMEKESHFLPKQKLSEFISSSTSSKPDKALLSSLQTFSEKFIADIANRAVLLTRHRKSQVLEVEDVLFTLEKEFDIVLTERIVNRTKRIPDDKHIAKMSEISRNK
ncbi:Transcription initiation factor TFIID subunit A [Spraguea lophii 42_110]|uniref:Transcription initiation factor TFIID subunit A n=1 Tax=Spraguea lophii (strain 42_110) TaxID=1358809 RepID=S7WB46_SPRLO|nr:Transcription initiation factor TFIID subunit A [Spraguea lophii 42_110]